MVNVGFTEGETTVVIDGLTQWDRGRKLRIVDDDLPAAFEVHFAPRACKTAYVVEATSTGGVATVGIPDEALQHGRDIRVYIYIDGKTVKTIVMPVGRRPKPEDYVYTPSERLSYASLEKRVDAIEQGGGGSGGGGGLTIKTVTIQSEIGKACIVNVSDLTGIINGTPVFINFTPGHVYSGPPTKNFMLGSTELLYKPNSAIYQGANDYTDQQTSFSLMYFNNKFWINLLHDPDKSDTYYPVSGSTFTYGVSGPVDTPNTMVINYFAES